MLVKLVCHFVSSRFDNYIEVRQVYASREKKFFSLVTLGFNESIGAFEKRNQEVVLHL